MLSAYRPRSSAFLEGLKYILIYKSILSCPGVRFLPQDRVERLLGKGFNQPIETNCPGVFALLLVTRKVLSLISKNKGVYPGTVTLSHCEKVPKQLNFQGVPGYFFDPRTLIDKKEKVEIFDKTGLKRSTFIIVNYWPQLA